MKFNQQQFSQDIKVYRRIMLDVSLRSAANLSGVSASTLSRAEAGRPVDMESFCKLCTWMSQPANKYFNEK